MTRLILILAAALLASCSERGMLSFSEPVPEATLHDIWVANFRATQPPDEGQQSPPRPDSIRYEHYQVSVPPSHSTGVIAWPDGAPDAATDFVTVDRRVFDDAAAFNQRVRRAAGAATRQNEVMVFVHGYNTNHAEALYLTTQVRHDFEIPVPSVLFSWPSAEAVAGYLYDRDSALIARDQLERVLVDLNRRGMRIVLMGHSMGNFLIMETLRQIELTGSLDVQRDITALFMISPDIDGELFGVQARRISAFPQPSIILAAEKDRALRVSAWLTGRTNRLGSDVDRVAVGDLPIAVIDVSAFSDGQLEHKVALQSPAAIAVLNDLTVDQLPSEASFEGVVRLTPDDPDER